MLAEKNISTNPISSGDLSLIKVILLVFIPTTILTTVYVILGFVQNSIPSILLFFALVPLILSRLN